MARRVLIAAALAVVLALAGCGLGPSNGVSDEGGGLAGGSSEEIVPLPSPDGATTAVGLVNDYLAVATGGQKPAVDRVKSYFTDHYKETWQAPENPQLTIVRVVGGPSAGVALPTGTEVEVWYQVVGTLNDQGRVEVLNNDLETRAMTFRVVQDRSNLRIDDIQRAPTGLLLSDSALLAKYRVQSVYFWDQTYTALIPDLRYVPLTLNRDGRAGKVMDWLRGAPSPWLSAQPLLAGVTPESPITENGKLVVRVNAGAAAGGPDADNLRRLLTQIQWTLRTPATPTVEVRIDDKVQSPVTDDVFQRANLSTTYAPAGQRYDIAEGKVVATPGPAPSPAVLAAPENQNVQFAAIAGAGSIAAFVRTDGRGLRYLQVLKASGERLEIGITRSSTMGRPAFVSPAGDHLLIPSGGQLYAVSTKDGNPVNVTPAVGVVTAVSMAPDGRRVAFVANNQVYVTSLWVSAEGAITVGSTPRPILSGLLTATSVAWMNETTLTVVGSGSALWQVTADGVAAENLSSKLFGATVQDVVAYPAWPVRVSTDVLVSNPAATPPAVYSVVGSLVQEPSLHNPFFGN